MILHVQYIPIYPNISQYIPIYPNISQYIPIYPNISQYFPIYPNYIPIYPNISQYFPIYPKTFPCLDHFQRYLRSVSDLSTGSRSPRNGSPRFWVGGTGDMARYWVVGICLGAFMGFRWENMGGVHAIFLWENAHGDFRGVEWEIVGFNGS